MVNDATSARPALHPRARASSGIGQGMAVLALTLLTVGCTHGVYTDEDPVQSSAPPAPRNACEAAFLDDLTADIGIALSPPPTPEADAVVRVMEACTARQLLEADAYLAYGVGGPMSRLLYHRLFNAPGPAAGLLAGLCRSDAHRSTLACRTQ